MMVAIRVKDESSYDDGDGEGCDDVMRDWGCEEWQGEMMRKW